MAYHLPVCNDDGNYNSTISIFHVSLTVRYLKYLSCIKSLRVSLFHRHVFEILPTFRNACSCSSSIDNLLEHVYGLHLVYETWC